MSGEQTFEGFEDLVEPSTGHAFPGKTAPINRQPVTVGEVKDKSEWWAKPLVKIHQGQPRQWYLIGHLARALGRAEVTIRGWERKGLIPQTRYRTQAQPNPLPGHPPAGRRLYTREQIEGILRIADEEGVILRGGSPPTERFAKRVAILFAELAQHEK